jgi:DNA processing protein
MTASEDRLIKKVSLVELIGRPLNPIEQKYAPSYLYIRGVMELPIPRPRVSIVGSRKASPEGLKDTYRITEALVKEKVTIISGLAEGIDTVAHETTIDLDGNTIGVIGTPLNKSYPSKNKYLQQLLMQRYLVVSQFEIGSAVHPVNFVTRNRTMALISDATVIVEAGEKSGSLHQGWEALRLGRSLFLWKAIVQNKTLKWPKEMIRYGAIELSEATDIVDYLPKSVELSNFS